MPWAAFFEPTPADSSQALVERIEIPPQTTTSQPRPGWRAWALQGELMNLFERKFDPAQPLAVVTGVFDARSPRHCDVVTRLNALSDVQRLGVPLAVLAASYVHMHLNRLLRAEQKLHEVVIYDFLVQLYTRQLARPSAR